MESSRWSASELASFSLIKLRGLDIRNKAEEEMVQHEVNARFKNMPLENPVVASSVDTDSIKSKEDELALQAKLDAENAKKKAKLVPEEEASVETVPEVPVETVPEPKKSGRSKKVAE